MKDAELKALVQAVAGAVAIAVARWLAQGKRPK